VGRPAQGQKETYTPPEKKRRSDQRRKEKALHLRILGHGFLRWGHHSGNGNVIVIYTIILVLSIVFCIIWYISCICIVLPVDNFRE